jgi:hypothetical protein
LEDVPLLTRQEMWLQQDGAPPHFGRQVTAFFNQHFADRWIGRGGPGVGQRGHQIFRLWTTFSGVTRNPWCTRMQSR